MAHRIVLSGGPGTGKTSIVNHLLSKDYVCFSEAFRHLLDEENELNSGINFTNTPLEFSARIYAQRLKQFQAGAEHQLSFYDRSLVDVLAYLDFIKLESPQNWIDQTKACQYHQTVFHFPFWEEIYQQDEHRIESLEQAKALDEIIQNAYLDRSYKLISVPFSSVESRADFILNELKKIN
ncbi:MAG: AAA family ATPase, partial [Flavobacteriales bacterium]